MRSLVEIHDLRIMRNGTLALELDQLTIHTGEVMAIVGPNGAGKSTLLLSLARLLRPVRGQILFNGKPVDSEPATAYRRRIALVMQDPLLFDTTVFQNVAAGLRFRGVDRAEIQRKVTLWLDRLGVAHLAKRRASKLSGGESQRVSLARAFVLQPEMLLLDEPFSSLDPPTRAAILEDLDALLSDTSTTTVFVTHDLQEAELVSDRIAVIIRNRLRQVEAPSDLRQMPADEEVARFLSWQLPPQRAHSRP